jgi:RimJ/RimL family protein N-acetyltransferase
MSEMLNTPSLRMAWSQAPWDEAVCKFPVLQINDIQVLGANADTDIHVFEKAREQLGAGLVSCRLSHARLKESMLLGNHGFQFVEMAYGLELGRSNFKVDPAIELLSVHRANEVDLPKLLEIASASFQNERFKMDPRLDPDISDRRFQNWVASSLQHAKQELYVIRDGARIVAFFITESIDDGTCYWHLAAVAPDAQGQGYGWRVWLSMLNLAVIAGVRSVHTSIAARNHRVLNLYARLGFKFLPPSMTFHWVRTPIQ